MFGIHWGKKIGQEGSAQQNETQNFRGGKCFLQNEGDLNPSHMQERVLLFKLEGTSPNNFQCIVLWAKGAYLPIRVTHFLKGGQGKKSGVWVDGRWLWQWHPKEVGQKLHRGQEMEPAESFKRKKKQKEELRSVPKNSTYRSDWRRFLKGLCIPISFCGFRFGRIKLFHYWICDCNYPGADGNRGLDDCKSLYGELGVGFYYITGSALFKDKGWQVGASEGLDSKVTHSVIPSQQYRWLPYLCWCWFSQLLMALLILDILRI